MKRSISELADSIAKLEKQLSEELDRQQEEFRYRFEGTRVRFEREVEEAHARLKQSVIPWLFSSRLRHVISSPFIYAMIVPIAFFDLSITIYQHICFRLYGIRRVERSKYIVLDRHQLAYLNGIEKLNCVYCGYGNGVVAYTREVIARTEQYWCPIKHARKVLGRHHRYMKFTDYGDGKHYKEQLVKLRDELR